jgi:hypothetical protein
VTYFALGVFVTLSAESWAPRIAGWWTAYRQHRRWMRHFKQPEQTAQPFAAPIWHGETTHGFKAMVRHLAYDESEET